MTPTFNVQSEPTVARGLIARGEGGIARRYHDGEQWLTCFAHSPSPYEMSDLAMKKPMLPHG
jgi:hypothetical protein